MPASAIRRPSILLLALALSALLAACAAKPAASATPSGTLPPTVTLTRPPSISATASTPPTTRPTIVLPPLATYTASPTPAATGSRPDFLPDVAASVTPIAPPPNGHEAFRLRPLDAAGSLALLADLEQYGLDNNYIVPFFVHEGYYEPQPAIRLLAQAALAFNPSADQATELRWHLAYADALLFDPARRAEAEALYAAALATAEDYQRPRLLYGQALAAELDGDAVSAAALYWQLWHDYPGTIYGFIGRARLEPSP